MSNDTTRLFGLSGVEVARVEVGADDLPMLHLVTAPLLLGGDLTSSVTNAHGTSAGLDPTDLSLLTNAQVIEVDQGSIDASRIALVGTPGGSAGNQVFAKVEPSGDAVVGLFNTTTKLTSSPVAVSTTAAALGLPADADGYEAQDLWGSNSVAVGGQSTFDISSAGDISATVPAEGVALYRVTPLN